MKTEHETLKTLSSRLNYVIQLTGTKKADLARAINVKPQVIQFLCTSDTKSSRFTFEIATALGLNTRWLATGDGEMFAADDPKKRAFKTYKKIPLLSIFDLQVIFIQNKKLDETSIKKWLPLETESDDYFAISMPDSSMEPRIPAGASIFIRKHDKSLLADIKIVFAYLSKFDTFVVRELTNVNSELLLAPINNLLYKDVKIDNSVQLLGIVTDCYWHIGSER